MKSANESTGQSLPDPLSAPQRPAGRRLGFPALSSLTATRVARVRLNSSTLPKSRIARRRCPPYDGGMTRTTSAERRRLESLEARALEQHQLARLNALLDRILPANEFYATKLNEVQRPLRSL